MRFLFTTRNTFVSKTIRWFLGEPCSHFAIYFNDAGIVVHSHKNGVGIDFWDNFKERYQIAYALEFKTSIDNAVSQKIFLQAASKYQERPYDYAALAFWGVAIILRKGFNIIYKSNLWGQKNAYLCTELAEMLRTHNELFVGVDWPDRFDMISPYQLYLLLKTSKNLRDVKTK